MMSVKSIVRKSANSVLITKKLFSLSLYSADAEYSFLISFSAEKDHLPEQLLTIGLSTVLYFPGRPVFQPLRPASRLESSRDARWPIFWPVRTFCFQYVEFQYKISRYVTVMIACNRTSESHAICRLHSRVVS